MSQTLIPPGCLQRLHILSVLWLLAVPLDVPAYIWIPITENLRVQFFSLKLLIDNNGGIGAGGHLSLCSGKCNGGRQKLGVKMMGHGV